MVTTLAEVVLKSGENMQVIKTTAPEPAWIDRILPFLAHKGDRWLRPMRCAYEGGLDDLILNDFLGVLEDGTVVGNITTVEHLGVAVLQHVFTPPEHRRKGICDALMAGLCQDFQGRGGRAMYLGTGHDSPPFHIYERFGFRGRGDSGKMTWLPDAGFDTTHFSPGEASVRGTRWDDWPLLEALYAVSGQWQLKGYHFGQIGHSGYEGEYPELRKSMDEGGILDAKVLCKADGAIVGHALLGVQPVWKPKALVLDCMLHANFYDQAAALLGAISIPVGRKVQAFCDETATAKMTALEALGFQREGVFARQMEDENHRALDVVVYGR
jgi:ribosomal protein S18 acetylase RimI-like enzyme